MMMLFRRVLYKVILTFVPRPYFQTSYLVRPRGALGCLIRPLNFDLLPNFGPT